jgi:hypothetical protein
MQRDQFNRQKGRWKNYSYSHPFANRDDLLEALDPNRELAQEPQRNMLWCERRSFDPNE